MDVGSAHYHNLHTKLIPFSYLSFFTFSHCHFPSFLSFPFSTLDLYDLFWFHME